MPRGERQLREQVGEVGHDSAAQRCVFLRLGEHLARRVAVAVREQGDGLVVDAGVSEVIRPGGLPQRDLVRPARGLAPLALDDPVDGHLGHPAPGGELAARDRHEPRARLEQLCPARYVHRLLGVSRRDERSHARVRARHVGCLERDPEEAVAGAEQVLDVGLIGRHVVERPLVVVVGRPDQRPAEPGEGEDGAPVPHRHDRACVQRELVVRERDVGAAARPDVRDLLLLVELLGADGVRPHASCVHHVGRTDRELPAGDAVQAARAHGAAVLVEQLDHLAPVRHHRPVALGLAEHGEHEPGVVRLAVVEEVRGGGVAPGQGGQKTLDLLAVDHAVAVGAPLLDAVAVAAPAAGQPEPLRGHRVVHVESHPHRALRVLALERRHEQLERSHQVRREVHEQRALEQRLAHQPEVEVLEVAKAAVHELRGAARGAGGVVVAFDERHAVPAGRGVERDTSPGDPAAYDHEVEELCLQRRQGVVAGDHVSTR